MSDLDARKDGHGVSRLRGGACVEDEQEDAKGIIPINKSKEEASEEEGLHTHQQINGRGENSSQIDGCHNDAYGWEMMPPGRFSNHSMLSMWLCCAGTGYLHEREHVGVNGNLLGGEVSSMKHAH